MAIYRLLGAATALAVMTAPAMAQQVMGEPGYCAFYYPNANCQNKGFNNPYTGGYRTGWRGGESYAGMRYHRSWRHARSYRRIHRMY